MWLAIGDDRDTRIAVITGAGRAFCAGADLETLQRWVKRPANIERAMYEARDFARNLIELDKPVVAAVNGPAVGAGCAVAAGSQTAMRWTKFALNGWLRGRQPILDTSLALEMLTFGGDDADEGVRVMSERRQSRFPSSR